jgi:hypothetical protein
MGETARRRSQDREFKRGGSDAHESLETKAAISILAKEYREEELKVSGRIKEQAYDSPFTWGCSSGVCRKFKYYRQ